MQKLTHFNSRGQAHMVNVGQKALSKRVAIAEGYISMKPETLSLVKQGDAKKGDVLGVARIAGIMASKQTAQLIPLCHPIFLTHVTIEFEICENENKIRCISRCETTGQTGVEMEALTSVQIGLLTVYDMLKAVDREMEINAVRLLSKEGGKSGSWVRKI